MRVRLVLIATFLAALVPAAGASAAFFPGTPIDGPSADIRSVGDVDVARDGTAVVGYVKRDAGVDHVFAARMADGAWQAPGRLDLGIDAAGSQPAVAASDGGRAVVVFTAAAQVWAVVWAAGATGWTAPQPLGPGSDPSVDMSINGVAYATFTSGGDVRAARLDRGATTFALLPMALDADPAATAGVGTGRSQVAIAADGTGLAVWGENGHVIARRLYGLSVSTLPLDLTLTGLEGHAGGLADAPQVDIEDDSSFAWIVFRQVFDDGGSPKPRAIARRLRGSHLDDPVAFDGLGWGPGAQGVLEPRLDLNGRGAGVATVGTVGGSALASVLKDDLLNPAAILGGSGPPTDPVGAASETSARIATWINTADGTVRGVSYNDVISSRAVPGPVGETVLNGPDLGPVDPGAGLDVATDRTADFAIVFVQGTGDARYLMGAVWDRPPASFTSYTSSKLWRNVIKAPLAWSASLDLWGPLTYTVLVDGKPVASTTALRTTVPVGAAPEGVHTWRVVATDRRGQTATTKLRPLKIDTVAPVASMSIKRKRRVTTVTARGADVVPFKNRASGVTQLRIDFGDGSAPVTGRKATHRYTRLGAFTIRVSAVDAAGNVGVAEREIRIGGKRP